ncbi:MAG: carbonic anhydrase [Gammaproteobacteria bacterium]|nr:carbonic anhydrase [Gammaproteobacteria bacterium]
MAYKSIREIFEHNERWIEARLEEDPAYFTKLSRRQVPQYLFIGCSDSRISSEAIMCAEPGDVFIHRNIANVIPVTDLNVLAVVNYAIEHIGVKHIVVCGHYGCGGIKTAMTSSDAGVLNPWLGHIRDVYRLHKGELNAIESPEARHDRLVELNVLEQCINLVKIRDVQKALLKKKLRIHGWAFDMKTGRLNDLHFQANRIAREVIDIYNVL